MAKKGSGVTIAQRKNGSWRVQIRKVGFPPESKDFVNHKAADEWGMRRLAEIMATGRLVNRRAAERTTFAAAIEAYIEKVTSKRPSEESRVAEEARLRRFLREEGHLCGHALAHVTPEMMEAWRDRRLTERPSRGKTGEVGAREDEVVPAGRFRKDGTLRANAARRKPSKPVGTIAPGTVKREMTLLKRIFDFAMRQYKLSANPLDHSLVDRPSVQDARDVRITVREWERLLKQCSASSNIWLAPFVELGLEIGARRGSLLKLLWSDVHLKESYIVLRGVKNSRNASEVRTVEVGLSPRAIKILEAIPRSLDGRVFPTTREAIVGGFKRARIRAELEHFRLHDSRHELASRLVEAGWDMLDVMRQGDWRDPKSVARYYNAKGSHLGAKLAKIGRAD
ncbi:tyrosine-type recombinase/integrase [Devosia aquimaris]|uniref:tyrosine-type recombinase/integrase n=1 Tax=Devosia aquimaris TaxID=2866214 RepID=UPI001CD17DF2|nr:site-specific integrase [Devosia sp. CJK-A8-3]